MRKKMGERSELTVKGGIKTPDSICVLLFYYFKLLFVFMTAKYLLSLTKLSQIKRACPSTASIT